MPSLDARISALEAHKPDGCPICFTWEAAALAVIGIDGDDPEPVVCPGCGRVIGPAHTVIIRERMDGPQ